MTTSKTKEVKLTKLERSLLVKKEMKTGKDGKDYGTVPGISQDFLWVSGAAKLAEEFKINGVLRQDGLKEEVIDGKHFITVTLDMVDENKNVICSGIGTWDNGEKLGNMQGARQRGIAMAYKRAYVLGIRYATNSFGVFTQDEDIVKSQNDSTGNIPNAWPSDSQINTTPVKQYDDSVFTPCYEDDNGVWRVKIGGKGDWAEYPGKELIDVVKDQGWVKWVLAKPHITKECSDAIKLYSDNQDTFKG